jgi:hypothetical protein
MGTLNLRIGDEATEQSEQWASALQAADTGLSTNAAWGLAILLQSLLAESPWVLGEGQFLAFTTTAIAQVKKYGSSPNVLEVIQGFYHQINKE